MPASSELFRQHQCLRLIFLLMRPTRHPILPLLLHDQNSQIKQSLLSRQISQYIANITYFTRVPRLQIKAFLVFELAVPLEFTHLCVSYLRTDLFQVTFVEVFGYEMMYFCLSASGTLGSVCPLFCIYLGSDETSTDRNSRNPAQIAWTTLSPPSSNHLHQHIPLAFSKTQQTLPKTCSKTQRSN